MNNDVVTVEPDYTKSGVEASSTYKNRVSDSGAEYPLNVAGHRLQVKYTFRRDNGGLLQLYGIEYYCKDCGKEKSLSNQNNLRRLPKSKRRKAREYLIGYFVETDCR